MDTLADRVRWEPTGNGIRISIPARKDWRLAFFSVWLVAWTYGGNQTVRQTLAKFSSGTIDWFACFWLMAWAFGECWVIAWIIWALGGQTTVSLDPTEITIYQQLFGFLLRRRTAHTGDVRNLRFSPSVRKGPFPYGEQHQFRMRPQNMEHRFGNL
jgi:hypothetical protein